MKKRFIVSLDSSSEEQDKKFLNFIGNKGLSWWHWLGDTWFLIDSTGDLSADKLSYKLSEFYPRVNHLVLELDENFRMTGIHGLGPTAEDNDMFEWLKNFWTPEGRAWLDVGGKSTPEGRK